MIKLTNIYSKGHIVVISSIQRLRIIRFFSKSLKVFFLLDQDLSCRNPYIQVLI